MCHGWSETTSERRQELCLSARPGQEEEEETRVEKEEQQQQQLCNRIKFIAPINAAVSLKAEAVGRN